MPAIPYEWMDSTRWRQEPLDWASHLYGLLAPQVSVRGRIALIVLFAIVWSSSWLLWRAYIVIQTSNDILVDKLGLDIPPAPLVTLEEIGPREIQISWKTTDASSAIQEYHVEVNGKVVGTTKKIETVAAVLNLSATSRYELRVFSVSAGNFQTPSAVLHVRTVSDPNESTQEKTAPEGLPIIRAIPARMHQILAPPSAPSMTREHSGGQILGRRGTTGRRSSPAHIEPYSKPLEKQTDEELDDNLAELSQKFQQVQQEIEAVELQIQEEERAHDISIKEQEAKRDEFNDVLKERLKASKELNSQVNKAETANRAAQNEKLRRERLLQQKEGQRRKRKDDIVKWDEQIASMAEEMAGIETQKSAIERRKQSEIREIRRQIEEEQKEVAALEEENKEKAVQIRALEEAREQLNVEDETEESREDDRVEREKQHDWRKKYNALQQDFARAYQEIQHLHQQFEYANHRLAMQQGPLTARRQNTVSFAPVAALDMDIINRELPSRRARHSSSHAGSMSSPRGLYSSEALRGGYFAGAPTASPSATESKFFNPSNGMTIRTNVPVDFVDDVETMSAAPMSPRADSLLPADLLGDESADEMQGFDDDMPTKPTAVTGVGDLSFPKIGSPVIREDEIHEGTPSGGSSSTKSFSSPKEHFLPIDVDRRSTHSSLQVTEQKSPDVPQSTVRKPLSSLFSFSRQRGKTMQDEPPVLGSLKQGESQSFPRKFDEMDPAARPQRRLSYGGNLVPPDGNTDVEKVSQPSRLFGARRGFPSLLPTFGKPSAAVPAFDPFGSRSNSFDPATRGDAASPRPSSIWSIDPPRPSMDSALHGWPTDRPNMRNSPLAPDWGSTHSRSFSRNHSRRPSIHYGSTSNLSLNPTTEEDYIDRPSLQRPLMAPIGTRPTSSQRPLTPKLNPAAPSFTSFWNKKGDKSKEKSKSKDPKDKPTDAESGSPPDSRKSKDNKDTASIAATASTLESHESLDRSNSYNSDLTPGATTPAKPATFISKITRKASSNKFGSWKEKGSLFSRKDTSTPTGEVEDPTGSAEQLGRSLESFPSAMYGTSPEEISKKTSRTSIGRWMGIGKAKKGKEDLAASEISESSERASDAEDDDE